MRILNTYYEDVPPSNVLTPEEIEQICCEVVPVDECSEVGRVTPYEGADQSDIDKDAALEQARADNPGKRILSVQIEDIGRPGKPCGKQHETWQDRLNCCDGVPPIYFDDAMTADVLPHGSSIFIFVSGGIAPFTFRTTSNGTWFPDGRKTWTTDQPFAELFAGPTFCGLTSVSVTDGCSSDAQEIRSDLGSWYARGNDCLLPGVKGTLSGNFGMTGWYSTAISGRYKVVENQKVQDYFTFGRMSLHCGSVPCNGCGDGVLVRPCPSGWAAMLAATFNECMPGIEGIRPCLDATEILPIKDVSKLAIIKREGVFYEWVASSGYGSVTGCGFYGSVQDFQSKAWVDRGPSGIQAWEWMC